MQISQEVYHPQTFSRGTSNIQNKAEETSLAKDAVTLSNGSSSVKDVALLGALGTLPIVGVGANYIAAVGASSSNTPGLPYLGMAGAVANIIGTGTAVAGLLIGNSTATYAGLGLLGASGMSAAVTASLL